MHIEIIRHKDYYEIRVINDQDWIMATSRASNVNSAGDVAARFQKEHGITKIIELDRSGKKKREPYRPDRQD